MSSSAAPPTASAAQDLHRESALAGRLAGVCLHLTSLPGRYGIGEIGAAAHKFLDLMSDMQLRVWQFLPLGPTAYGDSPYQPLSTFAGNEMLIDIAALVADGLLTRKEASILAGLPASMVDFRNLVSRKGTLLTQAADRFAQQLPADLASSCERFILDNDQQWLHDYALFRILKSRHGEASWLHWAPQFRDRHPAAMQKFVNAHKSEIERVKIVQFLFHRQWMQLRDHARERGIALFGDLPMYVALDSADAWTHREILHLDAGGKPGFVAGVPPDYFAEDGQLWGNPLYDWDWLERNGFRWWLQRIAHSMAHMDLVRIDHFRAFSSYWAVDGDARTARTGAWRTGPGDAFFAAVRAEFGQVPLVAEDLGDINDEVVRLRDRHAIPGMKVLQFEVQDKNFKLENIPECCVCYTGTHDNDTTLGWFRSLAARKGNAALRRRILAASGGKPRSIHHDLTRLAFASRARLAIVPMQDYLGLGSTARLNAPGTSVNNWRWRAQRRHFGEKLTDFVGELVGHYDRAGDQVWSSPRRQTDSMSQ